MSEIEAHVEQPEPNPSMPRATWRRRRGRKRARESPRIWFTEEEYKQIQESASLCGKLPGNFIREASLGMPLHAKSFRANAELVRELANKSGMALWRLAEIARKTGALSVADRLEKALQELRALIRQVASAKRAVITIHRRE
jgi:hypothetical protein